MKEESLVTHKKNDHSPRSVNEAILEPVQLEVRSGKRKNVDPRYEPGAKVLKEGLNTNLQTDNATRIDLTSDNDGGIEKDPESRVEESYQPPKADLLNPPSQQTLRLKPIESLREAVAPVGTRDCVGYRANIFQKLVFTDDSSLITLKAVEFVLCEYILITLNASSLKN